jgi:hypothetical protein
VLQTGRSGYLGALPDWVGSLSPARSWNTLPGPDLILILVVSYPTEIRAHATPPGVAPPPASLGGHLSSGAIRWPTAGRANPSAVYPYLNFSNAILQPC